MTAPELSPARAAIELVLAAYEPFPALAVDRHWSLVMSNRAVAPLLARVHPELLKPPINVLRVSLHPAGLAPHIGNLGQWRENVLSRLEAQVRLSAEPLLRALLEELRGLAATGAGSSRTEVSLDQPDPLAGVAVPFQLDTERGRLSFLSTKEIRTGPRRQNLRKFT